MAIKLTQLRAAQRQEMQGRIKRRVAEAAARANPCDCPLCQITRTLRMGGPDAFRVVSASEIFNGLAKQFGDKPDEPAAPTDVRH